MPASPGHRRPRGGRGTRSAESQGPSRNAPCPPGASLPVSPGNGHSERGQGSGRPRGSGAGRGSPCGPVDPSPLDHLGSALRPQPRPRPEGAPPSRLLGPRFSPVHFLRTPGPGPAAPGLLRLGAPPLEPRRELSPEPPRPGAPRAHPARPPARRVPGRGARRQVLRLPASPNLPGKQHSAAAQAFSEGELELGPTRPPEMSSGLPRLKPHSATS